MTSEHLHFKSQYPDTEKQHLTL